MKITTLLTIGASLTLAASASAATSYVYGFETATASAGSGTSIAGNDNWAVVSGSASVRNDIAGDPGFAGMSGNVGYNATSDTQISRANDGNFSYTAANTMTLSFVIRARNNSSYGSSFALADGGAGGEVAFQFGLLNDSWFIRQADFGTTTTSGAGLTSTSEGYLVEIEVDILANSGNGSGSLFVTNMEPGGGTRTAIAGLQNTDLGILAMDGGSTDISTWDSLYVRHFGGGSTVDTLTITAVPEPSSAALLGLGGLALILRRRK